jgi:hypothetical protein
VGAAGSVTGVDMTAPQLDVARRHASAWAEHLGYPAPNMRFINGRIEALGEAGITGTGAKMSALRACVFRGFRCACAVCAC